MTLPRTVGEILSEHTTLEVECIDRMYLNVYVPPLQHEGGVARFFRTHRGHPVVSSVLMEPISKAFVAAIETFATTHRVPLITFAKNERKDDVMAARLAHFQADEGVVFIGKAQEKTPVFRTEKRVNPRTGQRYPWLARSTAMVNHFYFYAVDRDFGPFFLKFGTYFPYTGKLCLNGHEYVKRQLAQRGMAYEALDNGILSCAEPAQLQALCDGLSGAKIAALLRRWRARLPHPFAARDRRAGYRYRLSIWQAEFSLTQVLDRPATGRTFFEEVIRENLDLGRPDQVQLIFDRRVSKRTPGRFRTRVITEGVTPSLHIDYKRTRIKQYHKEGRALRTETTMAFARISRPARVAGQRVSALPFADPLVQAWLGVLIMFRLLTEGWRQRDVAAPLAALLGVAPATLTAARLTYHLRRLRLHGLIERLPRTHRYRVTPHGLRVALFFTRTHARLFRPGLALVMPDVARDDARLRRAFDQLASAMDQWCSEAKLAA
jgi:hypothetical protein